MVCLKAFAVLVLLGVVSAKKLPSYIKQCKRSDPNLEKCAVKHANDALPFILKGDPHNAIPNLLPLEIPHIYLAPETGLRINMSDCKLFGLDNTIITHVKFNFEKKHVSITADIHHLNLISDYDIDGRILVLPITGKGPANITFTGGVYTFEFNYDFKEKHAHKFIHFTDNDMEYTANRIYIKLDNLFNGDKTLAEPVSEFLDASWKEVADELYPSLKNTIGSIIEGIASGFLTRIPFEEIFAP